MGKPPSEYFWSKHNHKFPHQCKVKHMSPQDIDPREVQKTISFHFLRVPFDGEAHWGFQEEQHLTQFLLMSVQK